ncbi:hypothetical protein ACJMK2_000312 [Sinanodonta woodiana]|uniref:TIR domain-containing protein n=1 Tax=Sinanodonta woodiana TaxID=1069815 RepID=A0ABD3XNV6_SINWO
MERKRISVLVTIYGIITAIEANVTCIEDDTSYSCRNIANKTDFPQSLHANTRKVKLTGTKEFRGDFPTNLFLTSTWSNVSELFINEFPAVKEIPAKFLAGLEHLAFLSISSCSDLKYIHNETFLYTPDLQALHLDENVHLKIAHVEAALTGQMNNLKYLSLIAIQAKMEPAVLGMNFSKAMQGKNLTYLDISRANIVTLAPDIWYNIISTVRYLNVSYSSFVIQGLRLRKSANYNIELVDISGCRFMTNDVINDRYRTRTCNLPENLKYVLGKNIVEVNTVVRVVFEMNLTKCERNKLVLLDISKNNLNILNVTITGPYICKVVQVLDLNSNNMEYISPSLLGGFPSLKILDLSKNQLHRMQNTDDFVQILSRNNELEVVFLRGNHLSIIPENMFSSNIKLRVLDLSANELTYFNCEWHNMQDLKMIDIRNNKFKTLPTTFVEQLENIFRHQEAASKQNTTATNMLLRQFVDKNVLAEKYRYGYNADKKEQLTDNSELVPQYLTIKLSENPLICDCDTLDYLQWILTTNISVVNRTTLICKHGNNEMLVNYPSLETVRQTCRLPIIIGTGIASFVAIIFCVSTFFIIHRRRRRMMRKTESITKLKRHLFMKNNKFKYVVFMPYCSKDYDIVEQNIRPSLNKYLKEKLHTDMDLVCTGADSFVPGMRIIDEIRRCIDESLVVVPVITKAFLQSEWSQEECAVAIKRRRKVVILMEQMTDISMAIPTLKQLIARYNRASWSTSDNRFVIHPSWNIICQGICDIAAETIRNYRKQNMYGSDDSIPLFKESMHHN